MGNALQVEIVDHVAEVTLCGPGKGNAMGPDFWRECPGVFRELDQNPKVRAIVVMGRGEHFTYGLDLPGMLRDLSSMLAPGAAGERLQTLALIERLQEATSAVESCRKPVIAAIWGWCVGGGVDFISACDMRVCAADARFSVREVKLAIVADLGTLQRLPRVVGQGHARELAMTGCDIGAERAARIGLVNDVLSDREATLAHARALAAQIVENSPIAVQGIKRVMNFSADHSIADGLMYVAAWNAAFVQSADLAEAVTAFVERRTPNFTGK
jgi:enoyl-CoA hydratase